MGHGPDEQIETDESGQVGATYRFTYLADDGTWLCDRVVADCQLNEYREMNSLLQLS